MQGIFEIPQSESANVRTDGVAKVRQTWFMTTAVGIRCWLDERQLLRGDNMHEGVDRGSRLWDKVLLCASRS
jgi:hypothetical protein